MTRYFCRDARTLDLNDAARLTWAYACIQQQPPGVTLAPERRLLERPYGPQYSGLAPLMPELSLQRLEGSEVLLRGSPAALSPAQLAVLIDHRDQPFGGMEEAGAVVQQFIDLGLDLFGNVCHCFLQ
jgi:hypothetical protein